MPIDTHQRRSHGWPKPYWAVGWCSFIVIVGLWFAGVSAVAPDALGPRQQAAAGSKTEVAGIIGSARAALYGTTAVRGLRGIGTDSRPALGSVPEFTTDSALDLVVIAPSRYLVRITSGTSTYVGGLSEGKFVGQIPTSPAAAGPQRTWPVHEMCLIWMLDGLESALTLTYEGLVDGPTGRGHVIRVRDGEQFLADVLLDEKSFQPVRLTRLRKVGEAGEVLTLSDYRTANGMTLAHKVTFSYGDGRVYRIRSFDRFEPNPAWPLQDKEP